MPTTRDRPASVLIAGTTVAVAALSTPSPDAQRLLAAAHRADRRAWCLCQPEPVALVIRHLASGRFTLARMPDSGGQHARSCPWYASPLADTLPGVYGLGAVVDDGDRLVVRLCLHRLDQRPAEPAPAADHATTVSTSGRRRRPAMTLGGLRDLLWQQADLNVWWPRMTGKRTWRVVRRELLSAAATIRVAGRGGFDLARQLIVPEPFHPDRADQLSRSLTRRRRAMCTDRPALLLGELRHVAPRQPR